MSLHLLGQHTPQALGSTIPGEDAELLVDDYHPGMQVHEDGVQEGVQPFELCGALVHVCVQGLLLLIQDLLLLIGEPQLIVDDFECFDVYLAFQIGGVKFLFDDLEFPIGEFELFFEGLVCLLRLLVLEVRVP